MNKLTFARELLGIKSWMAALTSANFYKILVDGNLSKPLMKTGPNTKLVGTDYNGNMYFENRDLPYNETRWVVYQDKWNYNPTSIPPEWHGWINYMYDYDPATFKFPDIKYLVKAKQSNTGTSHVYNPKGAWSNTEMRNWRKYEAWTPKA